jgi:hypothetical protein
VSLLNPTQAEIFYDQSQEAEVLKLKPFATEFDLILSARDIKRRACAYLRGFFLPLRLAALEGVSLDMKRDILKAAQDSIPKVCHKNQQELWKKNIVRDSMSLDAIEREGVMEP